MTKLREAIDEALQAVIDEAARLECRVQRLAEIEAILRAAMGKASEAEAA